MYSEHQCMEYGGIQNGLNGNACCASSCKVCSSVDCDARPGGRTNCCPGEITQVCGSNHAPCLLSITMKDYNKGMSCNNDIIQLDVA